MGLHQIPEFLFRFNECLDVLFITLNPLPLGFISSKQNGNVPVVCTRNCHVVQALTVISIRNFIILPLPVLADASSLDFKAGIFTNNGTVHIGQHERVFPALECPQALYLLAGFFLEPVSNVGFILGAPVYVLIIRQIWRLYLARLFHPQLVGRFVRIQPHDDSSITATDAKVSCLEPFFMVRSRFDRQNQITVCISHCYLLSSFLTCSMNGQFFLRPLICCTIGSLGSSVHVR